MLSHTQAEIQQQISKLSASESNDKLAALNALLLLTDNSDHVNFMMQQGASIPLLVLAQLHQKDIKEEQQLSTRLLIALVQNKQHAETIAQACGTLALITMVESSTCMLQKHFAIKVLKYLNDPQALELVQMNSLAALIKLLANPSGEIRRSTVGLLAKITYRHDIMNKHDVVTKLNAADGITALVKRLEDSSEHVIRITLSAIAELAQYPTAFDSEMATKTTTLLLERLPNEECPKRLHNTVVALYYFVDVEQCLPVFCQKGEVGFFVSLLASEQQVIRRASAKILKALLINTNQCIEMVTAKSLPYFMSLLQDQQDHVKGYAAKMIALLMENPNYRNKMIEEAIIPKLVALVGDTNEEEEVIEFAFQALKRLSEEHAAAISKAGVISTLTTMFTDGSKRLEIITILANCATHDPVIAKTLSQNSWLICSFCFYLRDAEFNEPQQKIIQLLLLFSESQALETITDIGNVTQYLVEIVRTQHAIPKEPVLHILKNLLVKGENLADEIIKRQAVTLFVTLLQSPENNIRLRAAAVLALLARNEKSVQDFVGPEKLTVLTTMLDDKNIPLAEAVLKIISRLTAYIPAIQPLLTANTVLKIANLLLSNPSDAVKDHCISILACLAEKGQCSSEVMQLYGLVPLVTLLSDANTSTQSSVACLLKCIIRDCPESHPVIAHTGANLGSAVKAQVDTMIQSNQELLKGSLKRGLFNKPGSDDPQNVGKRVRHSMTSSSS